MFRQNSRLAAISVLLVSTLPRCEFDDDPASGAGTSGGSGGYYFTTGGSTSADGGPCGIFPDATYAAAQLANCALVIEPAPDTSQYDVELLVNCRSVWPSSEADGGLSWSYSYTDHTLTLGGALCESLNTDPTQRVDVKIHYPLVK